MKEIKVLEMSLSQNLNNYVDDTVGKYIRLISSKYNLNYDDLLREWSGTPQKTSPKQPLVVKPLVVKPLVVQPLGVVESKCQSSEESSEALMKLTKQELHEKCKKAGVRSSGTKNDLVKYLLESKSQTKINTIKIKEPPPFVSQLLEQEKKETVSNQIVKKISASVPVIDIRRNKFNNYEHVHTGFVFNNLSKKVIGKQNTDGTVSDLTKEDINICNKYKFKFVLPSNLDKNTRVEDVKVDELEEEDGDVDEDVVEEEVEPEVEGVDCIDDIEEEDVEDDEDVELLEEEDVIDEDE
jgi:hypothetical protein